MRDYGRIMSTFWTGNTGRKMRGDPACQVLAAYLMSAPLSTMSGIYYIPIVTMAHETGLVDAEVRRALGRLDADFGFLSYDEDRETVFVFRMVVYQMGDGVKPTDKALGALRGELAKVRKHPFAKHFYALHATAFHLVSHFPDLAKETAEPPPASAELDADQPPAWPVQRQRNQEALPGVKLQSEGDPSYQDQDHNKPGATRAEHAPRPSSKSPEPDPTNPEPQGQPTQQALSAMTPTPDAHPAVRGAATRPATSGDVKPRAKRQPGVKVVIPPDWAPKATDLEKYKRDPDIAFGDIDLRRETKRFVSRSIADGWVAVNWDAKFRNWLTNERGYHPEYPRYVAPKTPPPTDEQINLPDPGLALRVAQSTARGDPVPSLADVFKGIEGIGRQITIDNLPSTGDQTS